MIAKLGIADRFAFICGQDTFGVGKPDPKPLLETIAASGGARERAIMVGDSGADIKTARAAGLPVVAVDFGYSDVPVAELGPDRVISHFDELAEACDALLPRGAHELCARAGISPWTAGSKRVVWRSGSRGPGANSDRF